MPRQEPETQKSEQLYEVPIVYKGQCNFLVKAKSPEEAEEKARARFNDGDQPEELGNEWEEMFKIGTITLVEEETKVEEQSHADNPTNA